MDYPGRWLLILLSGIWLVCVFAIVALFVPPFGDVTDLACDLAPTASLYGEASRSWIPPGVTCSWEIDGRRHVDRPPPERLLVVAIVLLGPPVLLYLRRLLRAGVVTTPRP